MTKMDERLRELVKKHTENVPCDCGRVNTGIDHETDCALVNARRKALEEFEAEVGAEYN